MDFGQALTLLKAGHRLTRAGWNGKGVFIELQTPSELSKMTLPYLYLKTVGGDLVPWQASQTDILAEDWERVVTVAAKVAPSSTGTTEDLIPIYIPGMDYSGTGPILWAGEGCFNPRGVAPGPKGTVLVPPSEGHRDATWADVVAYGEENGIDVNNLLLKAAANVARYDGVKVPDPSGGNPPTPGKTGRDASEPGESPPAGGFRTGPLTYEDIMNCDHIDK